MYLFSYAHTLTLDRSNSVQPPLPLYNMNFIGST